MSEFRSQEFPSALHDDPCREISDVDGEGKSASLPHLKGLRNGDLARSKVKQVASGRFGVTPASALGGMEGDGRPKARKNALITLNTTNLAASTLHTTRCYLKRTEKPTHDLKTHSNASDSLVPSGRCEAS